MKTANEKLIAALRLIATTSGLDDKDETIFAAVAANGIAAEDAFAALSPETQALVSAVIDAARRPEPWARMAIPSTCNCLVHG